MEQNKHGTVLETIVRQPTLVGVEKPLLIATEVNLYKPNGRSLFRQPDLLIINEDGVHIIEYTSTRKITRVCEQLNDSERYIRETLGYKGNIRKVHAYQESMIKYVVR